MSLTYSVCEKCGQTNRVQLGKEKIPVCGACGQDLGLDGALVVGADATLFKLIEKSPLPVVVDVWAPWCGPCRSFAPTFKEAGSELAGKFVFVKLNSDDNQTFAGRFGIKSIPSIIIFKGGREVARQAGALPRESFRRWMEQNV